MRRQTVTLLLFLSCAIALAAARPDTANAPDLPTGLHFKRWHFGRGFELTAVPEPSGMCFVPERNTLFLVDDGAADRPAGVYEISLAAEVLQKREVGRDLEGICYCPADGLLYAADEEEERVWVLAPDGLGVRGSFQVSRDFQGSEVIAAGGNGFEGIEYIPNTEECERDFFLLLNQDDPPALVRVERSSVTLTTSALVELACFNRLPDLNCGELWYDRTAEQLWVIHSWENLYEVLDIDTLALVSWEACPGSAQEALTKDGQGRLWIGSDSGGLAYYTEQPEE